MNASSGQQNRESSAEAKFDAEHRSRLENALAKDAAKAKRQEQEYLGVRLSAQWKSSVILVGAGPLGLRALEGLRCLGIEPLAFADNNAAKRNSMVGGLKVMTPAEAVAHFGTAANFIVCIWRSQQVMIQLAALRCSHTVEFKALFWHFSSEFLPSMRVDRPHLILQQANSVLHVYDALSDSRSRAEFTQQIEWLLKYDFDALPVNAQGEQYFEAGMFKPHSQECFVDCGAYVGDTLAAFLHRFPAPHALHAFEPEPANLDLLLAWRDTQSPKLRQRIFVHPFAVSDRRKKLRFRADGIGSAADERGALEVEAVPLDEALVDQQATFIKMDIEGGESAAIEGAKCLIARCRPVLAICLYHRQEHLFTVPNRLRQIADDYLFYIRRYGDQFGDVVCYGVPIERNDSAEARRNEHA
jgi:FkbM family methyltransferase